jgi:hypothetical protein
MTARMLEELCQRLDEHAAILEIMEGAPIEVALHRETSAALLRELGLRRHITSVIAVVATPTCDVESARSAIHGGPAQARRHAGDDQGRGGGTQADHPAAVTVDSVCQFAESQVDTPNPRASPPAVAIRRTNSTLLRSALDGGVAGPVN